MSDQYLNLRIFYWHFIVHRKYGYRRPFFMFHRNKYIHFSRGNTWFMLRVDLGR